jgi:hypothetical protein
MEPKILANVISRRKVVGGEVGLMTPDYYREQAARCRRLAREIMNQEIEEKLLQLAQEFERRAAELEKKLNVSS